MILDPIDQNIRDQGFNFVPFNQYLASPFQIPKVGETGEARVAAGLPLIYRNQGGGGGGEGGPLSFTNQGVAGLLDDFTTTTRNRYFDRQPTPLVDDLRQSKLDRSFMGFPSFKEQQLTGPDLGEFVGTNTDIPLELTRAGRIQGNLTNLRSNLSKGLNQAMSFGPISGIIGKMDRFSSLPEVDQVFTEMNMGYLGPTVFGDNNTGLSKDPYGINVRSAFGNYADYVRDKAAEYEDIDDEDYANLSTFQKRKVDFYRRQQEKLAQIEREKQQRQYNEYVRSGRQADVRDLQARIDRGDFNRVAPDRDRDSVTAASAAASKGVGGGGYTSKDDARDAAKTSYRRDGGRIGYMMGGLTDLVDIYD